MIFFNSLPWMIALRYLRYKTKDSNIAVMIKICFLGILVGTFALMLTLIITNGFEKVIHEKMRGINAPIVINSPGNKLDFANLETTIIKEFPTHIRAISGNSLKQVILDQNNSNMILFLKGIYPEKESMVTTLTEKIIRPRQTRKQAPLILQQLLKPNHVIIGYKTAIEHHLHVGDTITVLIPEPQSKKKVRLKKHSLVIAGIFKIGLEEYDNNVAFIAIETLNNIFDEQGVDQVTVSLTNDATSFEQKTVTLLQKRLPHLTIQSWKDLYPALVASLKLEKYVMFFVLALITLVACMSMISLLFMQVQHKRRDIAMFKAMGLPDTRIKAIFLRIGIVITVCSSMIGLLLAACVGYCIERYPFIQLPDVYYVSYLPARLDFELFVVVFSVTLLLGFLATWIPAHRATQINIAEVLRE